MQFIGKILPVEGYYVRKTDNPPLDYAKSLTHLYQPLLGMTAIVLYQTLLHEIDLQDKRALQTHHTLMNYLKIPLDEIYEARIQLEGIGLLKTFENYVDDRKYYIYELKSPFTPQQFFHDAMLSELLYHHIGEQKFAALKKHYYQSNERSTGTEVTQSFSDVFQTFQPLFEGVEQASDPEIARDEPRITPPDFAWIETMLKQRMIPVSRILTPDNKQAIADMMFMYDLATYEIEKSLLWALTEEHLLDIDEFKQACHDLFKSKRYVTPIELTPKKPEPPVEPEPDRPLTKREQLVRRLETTSPRHLLEDLSQGGHAGPREMLLIQDLMDTQGLKMPVMNVLIHYVLLQSNMRLSKAYLETIASHWARANLQTAQEAMDYAQNFKDEAVERQAKKQETKEVIPDWFKEKDKQAAPKEEPQDKEKSTQERAELEALMRQYAEES